MGVTVIRDSEKNKNLRQTISEMMALITSGDAEELRQMFIEGAPFSWKVPGIGSNTPSGPLELACIRGNQGAVEVVLAAMKSASKAVASEALSWASKSSSLPVLDLIAEALEEAEGPAKNWIDVVSPKDNGQTPLLIAAGRDNLKCVQRLLEMGADQHAKDYQGADALECAIRGKSAGCAKALLGLIGAGNVNDQGDTALMVALKTRFEDGIFLLIPHSNPDALNAGGRSALMQAACDTKTPLGVLEALAANMRTFSVPERRLVELAAAMGAASALGNDEGSAMLGEMVESVALRIEMNAMLPEGKSTSAAKKQRL